MAKRGKESLGLRKVEVGAKKKLKVSPAVQDGDLVKKQGAYYVRCNPDETPIGIYHAKTKVHGVSVETGTVITFFMPEMIEPWMNQESQRHFYDTLTETVLDYFRKNENRIAERLATEKD